MRPRFGKTFRQRQDGSEESARRKRQPCEETAEVLALLEVDRAAVDFRDVANDRETKAGAGLSCRVEASAARKQRSATALGDAGPVVLDLDVDLSPWTRP